MLAFMWQIDLIGVAKYINACLNRVNPPPSGGSASDQPGVAGRDVKVLLRYSRIFSAHVAVRSANENFQSFSFRCNAEKEVSQQDIP